VSRDLSSGNEIVVSGGVAPAIGPDGALAYARFAAPEDEPTTVVIEGAGADWIEVPIEGQPPPTVDRIAWDPEGDLLYVQTSTGGSDVSAIDLTSSDPHPMLVAPESLRLVGSVLVAPSAREPGVLTAIRMCCGAPPDFNFTTAELVEIAGDPESGWGPAQKVIGIDDVLAPGLDLFAVPAGHLDYENDQGWTSDDNRAWFVGDGDQLYLMDESGEKDLIPVTGVQGLAVNPSFAD
jgi:hypothetical protein